MMTLNVRLNDNYNAYYLIKTKEITKETVKECEKPYTITFLLTTLAIKTTFKLWKTIIPIFMVMEHFYWRSCDLF